MNKLYEQTLTELESAVNMLVEQLPPPKLIDFSDFVAYRYEEQTIHQAIVQKLARKVSTLGATRILSDNGFIQEQASLHRILDELREDVEFLVLGILHGDEENCLHREFLDAFYQEEFDAETAVDSTQKRPMIPRRKIQAYISKTHSDPLDPSSATELFRTISKTYSGFIHGASPQIMDMYGGNPGRFHMRGMKGTPVFAVYEDDLWNYFYRSICIFLLSTIVFNTQQKLLQTNLSELKKYYEKNFPERFSKK